MPSHYDVCDDLRTETQLYANRVDEATRPETSKEDVICAEARAEEGPSAEAPALSNPPMLDEQQSTVAVDESVAKPSSAAAVDDESGAKPPLAATIDESE
eukprot:7199129-Pyramimonas_sp.AAC.1